MARTDLCFFALALATATLIACGGSGERATPTPTASALAAIQAPAATATPAAPPAGSLPRLRIERVFPALSFQRLTGMHQAPDGRIFVLEQAGRIRAFEDRSDVASAQLFLDITDRVDASSSEMGLLGLALAPDFARSGVFYVNYTAASPRRTIVSRFKARPGLAAADPASEVRILEVGQPFPNHNGGQTSFGPDGYLYIGFGDGGSARDPFGNGQNKGTLLGKLLRIAVSDQTPGLSYTVPDENPFVGQAGVMDEIWAYGLRNPWRFSWDSQTGDLWLADVGQNAREEIDVIEKGGNYGWNVMEGSQCLSGNACDRAGLIPPIFDYPNTGFSGDCSVTGGFVYRGRAIAALVGAYVYGDYCSGRVWALRWDGARVTEQALMLDSDIPISSFAVDNQAELYVLAYSQTGGGIYRLVP